MKMQSFFLWLFVACVVSGDSFDKLRESWKPTKEEIQQMPLGFLGYRFGDKLKKSDIIKKETQDGETVYQVRQKVKFRSFKDVEIMVTPVSGRIYYIAAHSDFAVANGAEAEKNALLKALQKKYSARLENGYMSATLYLPKKRGCCADFDNFAFGYVAK